VEEIGVCVCGRPATDCHEITAGSANRPKAVRNRFTWLALCRGCHETLQGTDIARQLVYKAIQDEKHYDRRGLNVLRDREPDAIDEGETIRAAYQLGLEHGRVK
jgi:hypothetical protein